MDLGQSEMVTIWEIRIYDMNIDHRCQLQQTGGLGTNNPQTDMNLSEKQPMNPLPAHCSPHMPQPLPASTRILEK